MPSPQEEDAEETRVTDAGTLASRSGGAGGVGLTGQTRCRRDCSIKDIVGIWRTGFTNMARAVSVAVCAGLAGGAGLAWGAGVAEVAGAGGGER